jgi:hypothetical protein
MDRTRGADGRWPGRPAFGVRRFWEKLSLRKARGLWRRGCLWNTFVTIGRAGAFLELLRSQVRRLLERLSGNDLDSAYQSHQTSGLLGPCPWGHGASTVGGARHCLRMKRIWEIPNEWSRRCRRTGLTGLALRRDECRMGVMKVRHLSTRGATA